MQSATDNSEGPPKEMLTLSREPLPAPTPPPKPNIADEEMATLIQTYYSAVTENSKAGAAFHAAWLHRHETGLRLSKLREEIAKKAGFYRE